MHLASLLPLIVLPLSFAKNISIGVGQGGLVFNPNVVTADVGDLLQFAFYPKDHSVAQSNYSAPCQPLTGGVYSGFMPETAEGTTIFQVTVNSTDAIYLYCSQVGHCQAGMAMVVNPSSAGNSLADYVNGARSASTSSPPAIAGGIFIDNVNVNSTTSSSTSSTSSSGTTASTSPTSSTAPSSTAKSGAVGNGFAQWGLLGGAGIGGLVLAIID